MIGEKKTFLYPVEFVTLPDYTAHAGQVVDVIRLLTGEENQQDDNPMYRIRAFDGWEGDAFEDELV